ncbi:acyl-CoA/acyl-ACP dehydrogenase [Phormidium sp. FACHB-592]|uniref:Acyl-CoA/acyl-ACP dehydrogenase n=1 Tax=Stenomitos frigidus AS-A4 TaxID=2933935 RepID=A0ABV0KMM5_9CYAN|nr:acyl-CoA dehydrogenase family protein [Phormidium sp. FACHB-592]MBD2077115.1 acyl-CoA/acyl-ACP dehydrogenase [Phormidium sp. FACHB-592]
MQIAPTLTATPLFQVLSDTSKQPSIAPLIPALKVAIAENLAPQVQRIDQEGFYPREFMHQVGALGGFGQAVAPECGGAGQGVRSAVQVIEAVSAECLCTGFMVWCQIACTWYLQNSDNEYLKTHLLPQVATGTVLGGTGLSNPMKHFASIEKIALTAEKRPGGYVLNGLLPWVSNLGAGHPFGIAAKLADGDDYLMAIVSDAFAGLSLRQNAHFIALEGSGTYSCVFKDVFVPDEWILAAPCDDYVERIRPGFILTQVGMGLGLVTGCIDLIERYRPRLGHVNSFLDDQAEDLAAALASARLKTYTLADQLSQPDVHITPDLLKAVIQARITASELSLKAANAAMLHAGARAYLQGSEPARRLREAYFVAIVTPALKQLKKMLHHLEQS